MRPASRPEQAVFEGEPDEIGPAVQTKLVSDVRAVRLHRLFTDMQFASDLHARVTEGNERQNFPLPFSDQV